MKRSLKFIGFNSTYTILSIISKTDVTKSQSIIFILSELNSSYFKIINRIEYNYFFKKFLFVILSWLLLIPSISSQTFSLDGISTNEMNEPLVSAKVELLSNLGEVLTTTSTDSTGYFNFILNRNNSYSLHINYFGYLPFVQDIKSVQSNVSLGRISLKADNKLLKEIEIKAKKPIGFVKGDTTQYDASAFSVMKDASADQLVDKIPTITKENGITKAQGEEVKQVLVDGKPFFGNDPNLSLKNLPAEIIDKIQIFDQLSEQSQFTNINDGNTVKTINIVTKSNFNNGKFGKLYAGYGVEDKFQLGGNYNYFDGNRRISIIGLSNNINIQNFAVDDILGAMGSNNNSRNRQGGGPQGPRRDGRGSGGGIGEFLVPSSGGIATTHALGLNYKDNLGQKVEFTFSYFFNNSKNRITNTLNRSYFDTKSYSQNYIELNNSNPTNTNHRMNARIEIKLDSFNSFIIRPRFTFQTNNSTSEGTSETKLDHQQVNFTNNKSTNHSSGNNISNSLLYRHRFIKTGRTGSIELNHNLFPKLDKSTQFSVTDFQTMLLDTINHRSENQIDKWSFSSNAEYTEPLNSKNFLSINYRISYQKDEANLETFDILSDLIPVQQFNPELSNKFLADSKTHSLGIGYQYSNEPKWNLNSRINWQSSRFSYQQQFPDSSQNNKSYSNILPSLFVKWTPSRTTNYNIYYRSNTILPTVPQLQNVLNNSNPVLLSIGNPDLKQSLNHNFNFRFNKTNENASTLFLMFGGNLTQNNITNHVFIQSRNHPIFNKITLSPGSQLLIPENFGNSYQFRSYGTYSLPISKIKCNLSIDASYNYSVIPGIIDNSENKTIQQVSSLGIGISSNMGQNLDFNLQFRPSYNNYKSNANTDRYFFIENKMVFAWQFISTFIVRLDLNSKNYQSITMEGNTNVWLLNIALGKKIFKNRRGEFAIGINDLLDQNKNINQVVTDYYIEDSQNNSLTRFLMFSFTYQIRNYNSGKKEQINSPKEHERYRNYEDRR